MNLSLFIARKIVKANPGSFSSTVNIIAIASIGFGLFIMLISFLILGGFENTIRKKIYSFSGHINVTKYSSNNTFEEMAMDDLPENRKAMQSVGGVEHIQEFAHKAGLLRTDEEVQGVILKGIGADFNIKSFGSNIIEGKFIKLKKDSSSYDILISKTLADQLGLHIGNSVIMNFFQNRVRSRKLKIIGIFETSMEEFDKQVIIGDISIIQKLNNWEDDQIGGYEIFISDDKKIDPILDNLADVLSFDLYLQKVSDKYLQIFEWLTLLNQNVNIFLVLILIVACVNMGAILLILIMERTSMIGVLKALGASNSQLRLIFFYNGFLLVMKGMILGNILGLGLGIIQDRFKVVPLDPENYYMKFVPILWDWNTVVLLNILILFVIGIVLILPTLFITRVNPVKAIKFD